MKINDRVQLVATAQEMDSRHGTIVSQKVKESIVYFEVNWDAVQLWEHNMCTWHREDYLTSAE